MRIAHIQPSVISVPPNGWGAIEKIIWEYKIVLNQLGHICEVVNLQDLIAEEWDIVHCHMFDQALWLAEQKIPYFYSHHDHHSMVWGEESANYQMNLKAMQLAEVAFVHAKSSIGVFKNIPYYLSHGVNTEFFNFVGPKSIDEPNIIIVGNNGLAGTEKVFDRKGFRYAIEAAKVLNWSITMVGPKATQEQFLKENPDLQYEKLRLVFDADEEQLKKELQNAHLMIHATFVEAGHPPLTPLEAMSCGVPVIGTPMGDDVPQIVCERTTESVVEGIKQFVFQRHSLIEEARQIAENYDWKIIVENNLLKWYFEVLDRNNMANTARRIYHQSTINKVQDTMMFKYLDGARVDLVGSSEFKYKSELFIQDTQEVIYSCEIKCGMFAQSARKYHRNYAWKITDEKGNEFIQPYDAKNKRVYVAIESSSLGDSLAWMPIVEHFRLFHRCKLIVSTFWNDLFKEAYPEIEFIRAGTPVNNIYAMYRIGWYYDNDGLEVHYGHHSRDFRKFSLQGTACDILGFTDIEIKPKIKEVEGQKFNKKYVVIAPHASSHCKYWHHEEGWAKVVEFLNDLGYEVWNISKESASSDWENSKLPKNALKNVIDKTGDIHIDERISQIKSSSLFIGLGSGLSWLAWACGTPVVLISGFSRPVSEFTDCTRVFNQNVCNGCFNDYRLDAGNWNWCPKYENTDKMYECSKSITPEQVIDAIRKTLNKHQTAPDG